MGSWLTLELPESASWNVGDIESTEPFSEGLIIVGWGWLLSRRHLELVGCCVKVEGVAVPKGVRWHVGSRLRLRD